MNMNEWKKFAVVVDGEVAEILNFSPEAERQIAIYSSNPVIVPIPQRVGDTITQQDLVSLGSTWDGVEFSNPR